jgi:hypothetical protein
MVLASLSIAMFLLLALIVISGSLEMSVRYRSLIGYHISVRTGLRRVTCPLEV